MYNPQYSPFGYGRHKSDTPALTPICLSLTASCYSAEEAVKVIEEYCKLMNHKMGDCEIVIPLENREELRNITMSIPNNSILKNGEIKESKPRKK